MRKRDIRMTINDLLKRLKPEDYDKVIIFEALDGGWCNINLSGKKYCIVLQADKNVLFDD